MELYGAKKCFEKLHQEDLDISSFVSDRHTGIAKWIKTDEKSTQHYYDIWHIARSICKELASAGKEKGLERISHWIKAIRRHLYWCVLSTKQGFGELIAAKWRSIIPHIANEHEGHDSPLFKQCAHGELEKRKWIKIGENFSLLSSAHPF